MENRRFFKRILGFAFIVSVVYIFPGCGNTMMSNNTITPNNTLVDVQVINNTGRNISDVKFIDSNGSIYQVEVQSRQAWGNGNWGGCKMNPNSTYTLTWCYQGETQYYYCQVNGICGGPTNCHNFLFNSNQPRTIQLNPNNTWELVNN